VNLSAATRTPPQSGRGRSDVTRQLLHEGLPVHLQLDAVLRARRSISLFSAVNCVDNITRRAMKRFLLAAAMTIFCVLAAIAQTGVNADPEKARFVTSDIDNFWRAFDMAREQPDFEKRVAIYQAEYLDRGSVGLKDFIRLRIKDAKTLTTTVDNLSRFYASTRPSTKRIREMEGAMRKSFRKFKKLYPEAVFPDVYFVIGISNTGGTVSGNGLLVGAELYGLTPQTPRDEFVPWFKRMAGVTDDAALQAAVDSLLASMLKPVEDVAPLVAHESCHFNQKLAPQKTLLAKSLQEGPCDLVTELVAGKTLNPLQKKYGDRHEAVLWAEFQKEMNGADYSRWMYNARNAKDRPPDLGYYIGYKIAAAYYHSSKDKRQALRDILTIQDFPAFLERSRYAQKFASSSP
jgi:hypothetical protein